VPREKILVISDTHLTKRFNASRFAILEKLILESDKVVINGDFWDSWLTDFDGFLNSQWNKLFPHLLDKNTIYIFGNHDPSHKNDKRTEYFSVFSGDSFVIKSGGLAFHFEHGHKILESQDYIGMKIYSKSINYFEKHDLKLILQLLEGIKSCGFDLFGPKIACNSSFARNRNNILKNRLGNTWLICGDTHCPEVDNVNKFANSGCIIKNHFSYLIIEDGQVRLELI